MTTKRLLTTEEIDDILSGCYTDWYTTEQNQSVFESAVGPIKRKLKNLLVYPEIIPTVKRTITEKFWESRIDTGTPVGIIMGQVLGEDQTQSRLNSFHSAGLVLKNVISGVPRFEKLMLASKTSKGQLTMVYMKDPPATVTDCRKLVGSDMAEMTVGSLVADEILEYSETGFQDCEWYDYFTEFFVDYLPEDFAFDTVQYRMRLTFDPYKLFTWKITLMDIADALICHEDITVVFGPSNCMEVHLFINDACDVPEQGWRTWFYQNVYNAYAKDTLVAGIRGVNGVHFKREQDGEDRWMAIAEGVQYTTIATSVRQSAARFVNILALPFVDNFRTISNNIWDIYMVFGIEAAREMMIYEYLSTGDDVYSKNACHVELLVDLMIYSGTIVAASGKGVNHQNSSVLGRGSFEGVISQFVNAGVTTSVDDLDGVSASLMCGNMCRVGTAVGDMFAERR